MWRILQQDEPDDYVLATGESHSVREFVEHAFRHTGVDIEWRGTGLEEQGVDAGNGRVLVEIDSAYFRPTEVDDLRGDASRAEAILGWRPTIGFSDLVRDMVEADRATIAREGNGGRRE
jgi:GDPmannose 4,6-dehydratase